MLLNQTAEYALRAMAVLAGLEPGERVTAAQLSEQGNIPEHYVSKVMRRLVLARLVDGKRGHHGGFMLARKPSSVTLMHVLQAVEFEPVLDRCAFGLGNCDPGDPCALHGAYEELTACFSSWASQTTLVDTRVKAD